MSNFQFEPPPRHSSSSRARAPASFFSLQGRPRYSNSLPIPRKRRTIKEEVETFIQRCSRGSPHVPYYLQGTTYAALVREQFELYSSKCVTRTTARSSCQNNKVCTLDPASIPPDSFLASLISQDLRLPSAWNPCDTGEFVSVSADGMELSYKGTLSDDSDVSAARANFPFRPQCGIFYYEVEIVSKGVDGHIGIGFCWPTCSLDRLPGWEDHSWGYHGDDGHLFSGPGTSRPYGPKFGTGDIVGCGIDFRDMSAFYTMNGIFLGTAFRNILGRHIYPFVGFKTPGEHIRANFGQKQFVFDIEQYYKEEQRNTFNEITRKVKLPTTPGHGKLENSVIFDYLLHHGYTKSAQAFKKSVSLSQQENNNDGDLEQDAEKRQDICNAVSRGDIEQAIEMCKEYDPYFFDQNEILLFRLHCRLFLGMVKKIDQERIGTQRMDVDILPEVPSANKSKGKSKQYAGVKRRRNERDQRVGDVVAENNSAEDTLDFQRILEFGNELKYTYAQLAETNPKIKEEMEAAFSVIAYSNLDSSAVSHLYDASHTEELAKDLNAAMLISKNKNPQSSLERIYRQTAAALTEISLLGNARSSMFVSERDCLVRQD